MYSYTFVFRAGPKICIYTLFVLGAGPQRCIPTLFLYWGRGLKDVFQHFLYCQWIVCQWIVLSVNRGVSESCVSESCCQWIVVSVNRVSVNRVSVNRGVSESCVSESWRTVLFVKIDFFFSIFFVFDTLFLTTFKSCLL
jgi:hypothetical protein